MAVLFSCLVLLGTLVLLVGPALLAKRRFDFLIRAAHKRNAEEARERYQEAKRALSDHR